MVDIDRHRAVRLPWVDGAGERQTTTLKPADVVAGDVAVSYLETDAVQGATAGTVHLLRAGPWTSAVAVIDPGANAAARPRPLVPGPPKHHPGPVCGGGRGDPRRSWRGSPRCRPSSATPQWWPPTAVGCRAPG